MNEPVERHVEKVEKRGGAKLMKKTKIHQNLSINNIDNRQINAIIESTKENIVNRKEEGE
jgi:hypothetical protein